MLIRRLFHATCLLLLLASPVLAAKKPAPQKSLLEGLQLFSVGAAHSSVEFSVAWMGISRVRGAFSEFSGALALDRNDLTRSSATVIIRTKSLTTFHERRDGDLRSKDWFDVENLPTATFSSRDVVRQGDGYLMRGALTLRGVTKEIEIPFRFNGAVHDPGGDERVGFEGRVTLNRKDYGIVGPSRFNVLLEIGKAMVGDEVELSLAVEGIRMVPRDTLPDRTADSLWRAVLRRGAAPVAKDYRAMRVAATDTLSPRDEFRLNAVAYALVEGGRAADGLEMFRLQSEESPGSASGPSGMAYAYAVMGDRANAEASAEQALALNPDAPRALEILRRVRMAPGD